MENTYWFHECCKGKIYCNANESSGPVTCMGPFHCSGRGPKCIFIFVPDFYSKFAISFLKEDPQNFISFRSHKTDLPLNAVVTFDEVNWIQYLISSSGSNPEHVDYETWLFIVAYKSG